MANELNLRSTATGETIYATIRTFAGQMWNGSTTEALTVAHWTDYDIAMTETPASSYYYVASWPASLTTAGWYYVDVYRQAGASPDISDSLIASLLVYWDGTTASPQATDASSSAVASVTAGVSLADDAITSAKFDETTAFPLTSADAGATAVARTGADGDTLETLSDQIDGVPTLAQFVTDDTGETNAADGSVAKLAQGGASMTAEDIWAYGTRTLTQSAAEIESVVRGSLLTFTRGDTISASLTGLGSLVGRQALHFTVKSRLDQGDAASIIQIEEDAGLIYLNGAAATSGDGALTVDDESAGDITIVLEPEASSELAPGSYSYDVQWLDGSNGIHTLTLGALRVVGDVTRAIPSGT